MGAQRRLVDHGIRCGDHECDDRLALIAIRHSDDRRLGNAGMP